MAGYVYDTETNGFLDALTTLHCLVLKDEATGHIYSCHDHGHEWTNPREGQGVTTLTIDEGLALLEKADRNIAHNGIRFDAPAIAKVKGKKPGGVTRDTLLLTKLIWPAVKERDFIAARKGKHPKNLIGSYSLEAWGHRLGNYKGDFAGPFEVWTPEMQEYCEQDVEVTFALWERIKAKAYAEWAIEIEHDFAEVIFLMEQHGVFFDVEKATKLYAVLSQRRLELESELKEIFPPWFVSDGEFTPKRDNKKSGYTADCPLTKAKLTEFNPASRDHVADRLKKLRGWKPRVFTDGGKPAVDDEVLAALPYPEAKKLSEYLMVGKRIGALAEGKNAWLKHEKGGKIFGRLDTLGTVTRRGAHHSPNLGQTPSVENAEGKVPYGYECRELFYAPDPFVQVGADASGVQLRILAHYMARYDDGAYADLILNGDVHKANMESGGLPSRATAKRFIYAFILGAGDAKVGEIIGKGPAAGKKIKNDFLKNTPALKRLKEDIEAKIKRHGYLKAVDGGILHIRSPHAALASLMQSGEACSVKLATVNWHKKLCNHGYVFGKDYALMLHVHDELQSLARKQIANEVGQTAVNCIREAGVALKLRCPLDGEFKIGRNWAETH